MRPQAPRRLTVRVTTAHESILPVRVPDAFVVLLLGYGSLGRGGDAVEARCCLGGRPDSQT